MRENKVRESILDIDRTRKSKITLLTRLKKGEKMHVGLSSQQYKDPNVRYYFFYSTNFLHALFFSFKNALEILDFKIRVDFFPLLWCEKK